MLLIFETEFSQKVGKSYILQLSLALSKTTLFSYLLCQIS